MCILYRRLFPFGRGLVHSYWAPNFYALYCAADKALKVFVEKKLKTKIVTAAAKAAAGTVASTSGLVGNFQFYILPSISPAVALGLTVLAQLPAYYRICTSPTHENLFRCLLYSSLSSFYFGYHVHEKAIVISQILSIFLCCKSGDDSFLFIVLSMTGFFSLFPLLYQLNELFIKGRWVGRWLLMISYDNIRTNYVVEMMRCINLNYIRNKLP